MNIKLDAIKIVNVSNITDEEWLQYRQTGIGGSDAAAIAGVANPKYSSKFKTFQSKTNPIVEIEPPGEYAEMGHLLEPIIRQRFKDKNPHLKVYQSHFMWRSSKYPFMLANVDGLIKDPKKGWGVLECKNMSEHRLKEFGTEEIPIEFIIQGSHYMEVLNLDFCIYAVFIGGNKYREFHLQRDDALIDALVQLEQDFWENHILTGIAPDPDGSEASGKALASMYNPGDKKPKKEILELPVQAKELTQAYEYYSQQEAEMKKKKDEAKQQLQVMLGAHQTAQVEGDEKKVRWTFSREFKADLLKEQEPELYSKFVKPTLDTKAFQKAYPSKYKEFMVDSGKRRFLYE
ncbi:lambda-exonuclease family protein [Priestia megaterium]|uniref:YqaJ viral recombinase family nuclease n=1 Tax=Priestia megaterium TaxID=1404 RepID=UPI002E1E31EF|nr:YqaJ viral recombinase family protein [Priestia megaterium]MED4102136.1 YqaJ viral recombinase family protein [Priestia megaterium]MED4142643.1 YqaJ viral recombinase family protein [Priestia megaterium]